MAGSNLLTMYVPTGLNTKFQKDSWAPYIASNAGHMTGHMTWHGERVDADDNDHHQQDQNDAPDNAPLVAVPDELEGLQGRREPQERGGWTT